MEVKRAYGVYPNGFNWSRFTVKRVTCTKCGEYSVIQNISSNGVVFSESCGNHKCWKKG